MVNTRERILRFLQARKSQADIARELAISRSAVSKHVAKLVEDGLWQKPEAQSAQERKRNSKSGAPRGNKNALGNPGNCNARPPLGNKNAVTTGEHETIWDDVLDADERRLFREIDTGKLSQIDHEIRIITIREHRMMQRIERLRMAADEYEMTVVEISHEKGEGPKGPVDLITAKRQGVLGQIQHIEEALTRVQEKKARLLELKHKVESGDNPAGADVKAFKEALAGAAAEAWEEPEEGDGDAE